MTGRRELCPSCTALLWADAQMWVVSSAILARQFRAPDQQVVLSEPSHVSHAADGNWKRNCRVPGRKDLRSIHA